MIEMLKPGIKKFTHVCLVCGCIFTYELEDVELSHVTCPDCGTSCRHDVISEQPVIKQPSPIELYYKNNSSSQCDDCWFTKKMKLGEVYIGDSPCDYCPHYLYKGTCGASK